MRIHVYSIMRNERRMVPFFLRHYEMFAARIFVYDDNSTDGTRDILAAHPLVEIRTPPKPLLDDGMFSKLFSSAYKADPEADWVINVDADEIVWSPDLIGDLQKATEESIDVIDCLGFEMQHHEFPRNGRQIYDEVQFGQHADWWTREGLKPCIIKPRVNLIYWCGRHSCTLTGNFRQQPSETIRLLHFRDLGYPYYLWHHQRNARRLDPKRRDRTWGKHNFSPLSAEGFRKHIAGRYRVVPCQFTFTPYAVTKHS